MSRLFQWLFCFIILSTVSTNYNIRKSIFLYWKSSIIHCKLIHSFPFLPVHLNLHKHDNCIFTFRLKLLGNFFNDGIIYRRNNKSNGHKGARKTTLLVSLLEHTLNLLSSFTSRTQTAKTPKTAIRVTTPRLKRGLPEGHRIMVEVFAAPVPYP